MNLFDLISQSQDGRAIENLANQFGLETSQAEAAVRHLAPALGAGLTRNTGNGKGLADLVGALSGGQHQRYADDASLLGASETVNEGNGILGHLFGSKQVSRKVAQHVSAETGIGATILKKMLPVIASVIMGALAKKMTGGSGDIASDVLTKASRRSGSIVGNLAGKMLSSKIGKGVIGALVGKMLMKAVFGSGKKQRKSIFGSLLDRDGDGSYADDLIGMATKGLLL